MRRHWHNKHNRLNDIEPTNKRFTFVSMAGTIGTAALLGGGVAAGLGAFGGDEGEGDTTTQTQVSTPQWYGAPEYPEASGARSQWWNTLQDWGKSGTYGASMPDYNKVYENAQNRINQYYWGGASGGGLIDKIRAGAARRGVAESPAIDVLTQRMGAEQAGKLGDISTNLDVTKANAVEQARTNWLNSIMNLSNMKPQGTWGGTNVTTSTSPYQSYMPSLIGAGIGMYGNQQTNKMLSGEYEKNRNFLTSLYGMPSTSQESLTGVTSGISNLGSNIDPISIAMMMA